MTVGNAVYKVASAEIAPRSGEVNAAFSRSAARKAAFVKQIAVPLFKRVGGGGDVAATAFIFKGNKFAVFKQRLRPAENKVDRARNAAEIGRAHV